MIRWSYAVLKADGGMEMEFSTGGPIQPERLMELVGGEPSFLPFRDGVVAAMRKDIEGLPVNQHFLAQGGHLKGVVVLGKHDLDGRFVGALGVQVNDS